MPFCVLGLSNALGIAKTAWPYFRAMWVAIREPDFALNSITTTPREILELPGYVRGREGLCGGGQNDTTI